MRPPYAAPPPDRQDADHPPAFNVPPATLGLAAVLVVVFAALRLMPEEAAIALVDRLSFNGALLREALAGRAPLGEALLRTVSYAFIHIDGLHIAVNVGFLLAFASPVERRLGAVAFLSLFFIAGIVGALFEAFFFVTPDMLGLPAIGASGGIFGLMGAALLVGTARPRLDPRLASELDPAAVAMIEARMARTARTMLIRIVVALMALNLVIGLLSELGFVGQYLIGWRAHLGGFLVGLAVGWLVRQRDRRS
jgi:membrane associated rhomboid family serine protease